MSADRIVDIAEPVPGAFAAYALAVEFHGAHIGLLGILLVDVSLVGINWPVAFGRRLAEVGNLIILREPWLNLGPARCQIP